MTPTPEPPRLRVRKRITRCYELSWMVVMDSPAWVLVHGTCRGPTGEQIGHAWVETLDGQHVYETMTDRVMCAGEHADYFAALAVHRYLQRQAAEQVVKSGHYGPWAAA